MVQGSPPDASATIAGSLCRFCHAQCAAHVEVVDGRVRGLRGIPDNEAYHGFTCTKGRELPAFHTSPHRLLRSLARGPDGSHRPLASGEAMDAIGDRLRVILDEHGPRSVAIYIGTHGYNNLLTAQTALAFMDAIESPMVFTSVTIDQPGKAISTALHGTWLAGAPSLEQSDVWLATGTNPLHSMLGPVNPGRAFRLARERGLGLVVIDPRRTEFARRADVHLQARPGEDPTVLAGLLRVIFSEGLQDDEFLSANVRGQENLREIVEAFTPQYVERRADVPASQLERAARIYAAGRRGVAVVGTGPNMSGRGNLTEYLTKALMTVCGHWLREGDAVANPGVLINWPPRKAQAVEPSPAWGFGEKLRVRGLGNTAAGLPTAAAADEILLEGEGQVRALLNLGGNPLVAWPDQKKTHDALGRLDLLVSIDPVLSATARVSDYVIAPTLSFETAGCSALSELLGGYVGWGYSMPYGHWAPKLVDPPAGSDVIDDWTLFHGLARRLGHALRVKPITHLDPTLQEEHAVTLDGDEPPTSEELWEMLLRGSPVPLAEVKPCTEGHVFARDKTVDAKDAGWAGRLDVGSAPMIAELHEVGGEPIASPEDSEFAFRLISRRLPHVHNSSWHLHEPLRRKHPSNPAFMHPDDLERLGVTSGSIVEISSAAATIQGVVEAAPDLRRGLVSMPHCWGGVPGEDDDVRVHGGNTSRLSSTDRDFDRYSGIPRMSTIPVNVRPATPEPGQGTENEP
ncbi:MAG: molybdopterin-dependent oxidoreductase [Candidatus Binatia bacterium]|nr:molybdopterin-dependent oxidoreductase [Candidatus Binatia bacterium]